MAKTLIALTTLVVLLVAALYQTVGKTLLFVVVGLSREVQSISDFPYTCRSILDERLQACEDMWLSESSRTLYLACSDSKARMQWLPAYLTLSYSLDPQNHGD